MAFGGGIRVLWTFFLVYSVHANKFPFYVDLACLIKAYSSKQTMLHDECI